MNHNRTITSFSFVTIGRVSVTILQGIFYLIFASLLGPELYGQLNVIIALAGTFSIISNFGLSYTLQVYRAKENFEVANQINTLFIISTSIAALILLTQNIYASILCVTMSFFLMTQHDMLGLKNYKSFMVVSILKGIIIIIVPLLLYFTYDLSGIILGMALANFATSLPYLKNLKIRSISTLKHRYKVLIHNFGLDASSTLPLMIDKLLIAALFGLVPVGIYQFNLQIYLALSVIPGALSSYLISEESTGITHRKLNMLVVLSSIGTSIISIFISPYFVNEFFPNYSSGIFSLQILLIGLVSQSISSIYSAKLIARESTKIGFLAIVKILSLLLLIAWLGNLYGLVGLSLAVLISSTISTVFLIIMYHKLNIN